MWQIIPFFIVATVFSSTNTMTADESANPGIQGEQSTCKMDSSFGRLPLYFIENQGQMDREVAYYAKGSDKTLYFTSDGITFALTGTEGGEKKSWIVKLEFENAEPVRPKGKDMQKTRFSYFRGKPEDWHAGIATYSKLIYKNLWPGIDLVYSGSVNQLKYDFVVRPGSDPSRIRLAFRGAAELSITDSGALRVYTPVGGFEDGKPNAYQSADGIKKEVSIQYAIMKKGTDESASYGFDIGSYDSTKPLILDPVIFVYCGFVGGNNGEYLPNIALDASGCAYVAGFTLSDESTFPVKVGPDLSFNGGHGDTFVAKVNALGTELVYCGYIGGENSENYHGIAVDTAGCAYVSGRTNSDENSNFPVLVGPDLTWNGGAGDTFVAKVNEKGTGLVYCGYIGGEGDENFLNIAVDTAGCAYVSGCTFSDENSFPVKVGPDLTFNGHDDIFVAKVNEQGTGLDYCGYIGGEGSDCSPGIAIDSSGCAYVSGCTFSDENSFPVKVGPDLTWNGGSGDAFVAKVNEKGTGLDYCGYIGGENNDAGYDIAVDAYGCAYLTGVTGSDETSFPVFVGPDLTFNGDYDAFMAKVSPLGSKIIYCGYIGGKGYEHGKAIAVDTTACAYVTGKTDSVETSFPVSVGPDLTWNGGASDAFVAKVSTLGRQILYCGYIGGKGMDIGFGIAVCASGCVFVTGEAFSDETSFPVVVGPDLSFNGQYVDVFVAKIALSLSADLSSLSAATGGIVNYELYTGPDNANRTYLLLGCVSGTNPGYPLPGGQAVLPLNWDNFTNELLLLINTSTFVNFMGILDNYGTSWAQLNAGKLRPDFIGITMHFAFCLNDPFDLASNPLAIEIIP